GGVNPIVMTQVAILGERLGFDEININCGCPSKAVQHGQFGVLLMRRGEDVAKCIEKMRSKEKIPITVKCRLGVDYDDSFQFLCDFVSSIKKTGVDHIIVHVIIFFFSSPSLIL